jgi:hypothetical protein
MDATGGITPAGPVVPLPNTSGSPLLNGAYGLVDAFNIQTDADQAAVTAGADALAQLNGTDVVISFPSSDNPNQDQVRTVTQLFALESPPDTNSFAMRKALFQNAICWMLQCGACAAVYPTFGFDTDPFTPETGVPVTINLRVGNNGECDAVAFVANVQLADGLKFVSATADFGKITQSNQVVSLTVGRISGRQIIDLAITVIPQVPGWLTNQVDLGTASTIPQTRIAAFEVQGVAIPQFSILRSGPNEIMLRLSNAESGSTFSLQRVILQPDTPNFPWTTITNFSFTPPDFEMTVQLPPTNSAALYRVLPQ